MSPIPRPQLVGESINGALCHLPDGRVALCLAATCMQNTRVIRPGGPLVVRYALPYLQRELAIIPGLFASEYGAILVGQEAWDYALKHANLHPRADLLGIRTDGVEDQVMIREIDFGRGVEVWAFADETATSPITQLDVLCCNAESALPPLLAEYLPRIQSPIQPAGEQASR
ncbi:MAG: hypothetical protein Kow0077_05210 [Anaerolineae bacterium]